MMEKGHLFPGTPLQVGKEGMADHLFIPITANLSDNPPHEFSSKAHLVFVRLAQLGPLLPKPLLELEEAPHHELRSGGRVHHQHTGRGLRPPRLA